MRYKVGDTVVLKPADEIGCALLSAMRDMCDRPHVVYNLNPARYRLRADDRWAWSDDDIDHEATAALNQKASDLVNIPFPSAPAQLVPIPLTKRELIAAMCLQGILSMYGPDASWSEQAVLHADTLIKELDKTSNDKPSSIQNSIKPLIK